MNLKKMTKSRFLPVLVVICTLILPSPLISYFGISTIKASPIIVFFSLLIAFFNNKWNCSKLFLFTIFSTIGLGFFTSIHYINIKYSFLLVSLISNALLFNVLNDEEKSVYIDYASVFLLILEVGAILGFLYMRRGGTPVYVIKNPDGRSNSLFLTTFSNVYYGRIIRPSGIYDEAGAFSFFIISICLLRIIYRKKTVTTVLMLVIGCITFSVTHILCMFILLFVIKQDLTRKQRLIFYLVLALLFGFILYYFWGLLKFLVFSRFQFDSSKGTFSGDNRSGQIVRSLNLLRDNGFLYGAYDLSPEELNKYGDISSNPFSLLAINGFFNSIMYYIFILLCIVAFLYTRNFLIFTMLLLLLQRPYQNLLGYSFFFIYFFDICIKSIKRKSIVYHQRLR